MANGRTVKAMRLIDADKLKRKCQKVATEAWKMKIKASIETTLNQFIDWIDQAEPVDAVPVVHGRWIRVYSRPGVFKYLGWTCDQCGQRTGNEYAPQWYKFCPNCGAKMDGTDGEQHDTK